MVCSEGRWRAARDLETQGVPIVLPRNRGTGRKEGRLSSLMWLLACNLLGRKEVPTINLEHLSPAQARAFMIADNRLTEIASWDDRLLGEQLRELSELNLDFSLEATGFDMAEIDLLIEGASATPEPDPDDVPLVIGSGPAVTRPGDTWLLGRHRIYCGSALDEAAYRVLMEEDRAAMVFTDPPYNVPIDGHVGGLGAIRHREFAMASGEMDEAEYTAFLTRVLGLLAGYSRDGALHFICMDWRHMSELLAAGKRAYTELKKFHRPGFEIKAGISAFHDGRRAVRNRGHLALCVWPIAARI